MSQIEIAHEPQASKQSCDVQYLRSEAKESIKEYIIVLIRATLASFLTNFNL
jgi:hypothetical protein